MITRILETILYCRDLDGARAFYADIIGLRQIIDMRPRSIGFRISADATLLIFNPDETPKPNPDVPSHGAFGPGHVGFGVEAGALAQWRARLTQAGVEIERETTWRTGARSIYFRDPDRNSVELIDGDPWPS